MMTQRRRILIVDDNAALVENLDEILSDAGYSTVKATSAAEALTMCAEPVDVALVDLRLPDGDGSLLAGKIREVLPDAEVVMLTGFATVESAAAAVRLGAFAFLVKPVETPQLLLTLEQALRQVALKREKRELARRAATSEKLAAVGTLTAGLSHEIRNPLNGALLQLQVLDRRLRKLSADQRTPLLEPLHLVRDEIHRLDRILEDFLQFARPRELNATAVPLEVAIKRCFDLLASGAERRRVSLRCQFDAVPAVRGDDDRLKQVVMNLVLNAIDATPDGGTVTAALSREGDDVLFALEDAGPGVPPELQERIFEPFFTTKAQGSGLGLPIVHAIVTQHGGSIQVRPARSGGSRFEVRLPAVL